MDIWGVYRTVWQDSWRYTWSENHIIEGAWSVCLQSGSLILAGVPGIGWSEWGRKGMRIETKQDGYFSY